MIEPSDELPTFAPVMKIAARPQDVNIYGDIFGGWLMSQVDIAGSICARDRARGRVATRAVSAFDFLKPVKVGDLVSVYAQVVKVGTTSLTVDVQVFAERHTAESIQPLVKKVAVAQLVFVAVDGDGASRVVPPM